MTKNRIDIGEVAAQSGVPASKLRYYEERGLIAAAGRRGLRRVYSPDVLERLALIAIGQTAGFSLDEIRRMLTPDGPRIDRALLTAKADELEATIRKLGAIRDGLRHAAACSAPSHAECPTFRRIVRAAIARGKRTTTGAKARPPSSSPRASASERGDRRRVPGAPSASARRRRLPPR